MLSSVLRSSRRLAAASSLRSATLRSMSTNGFDPSIPDEWVQEPDETEGEWKGCTKRFLAPIKINSRGSGEFLQITCYWLTANIFCSQHDT